MPSFIRFLSSPAGLLLRYGVSVALIGIIAAQVDWRGLAGLRGRIDEGLLAFALALALLAMPLCAVRWWLLMRAAGARLSFARAHAITWVGQFYNAFLPGGLGGDAARLIIAFRDQPDRRAGITTATIADRALGFAVLLALSSGALLLHSGTQAASPTGRLVLILAAGGVLALVAGVYLLPFIMGSRVPPAWREAARNLSSHPGTAAAAGAVSVAIWLLDFASGWYLARSLGLPFGILAISAALGLAYLSTILPISLGGHGLREGSLVLALVWFDDSGQIGAEILAPFALLFLTLSLISSLVGGAVLLFMARGPRPPPAGSAMTRNEVPDSGAGPVLH